MEVIKRNGSREAVSFDKILARIDNLCYGLNRIVDPAAIAIKVIQGLHNGIHTSELDDLATEVAAYQTSLHPDFSLLAARISVSNLHKNTLESFAQSMAALHARGSIADDINEIVQTHADFFDQLIVHDRDYALDFFGFRTLHKSYLLRIDDRIIERPQYMIMRTAVGIHGSDLEAVQETYELMSKRYYTHATPTLFNAGTPHPQMSSCFLLAMDDDSIEGIFKTLGKCASISKSAGGIGFSAHNVRAKGSYIHGSGGTSNGLVPMLRVFDATARYVDQGGGKRKGAFAVYLEPWHADIEDVLMLKRNHGKEENRARDLFYGLWIPDEFMRRVEADAEWALFCPNEATGLADVWGAEFDELYRSYELKGLARKTIRARKLWNTILDSQIETGTPYLLYKDAANSKSNQQNLGTIRCSNLCTEIIEYTSPDEVAVCNLASISLPAFIAQDTDGDPVYDFEKLHDVVYAVARSLDRVIDRNAYPVPEARRSNMRHRPIGIGVQGLADVFFTLNLAFDSPEARKLNTEIFETIYHAALDSSNASAIEKGPYETFPGSPLSKGIFQFDMWVGGKEKLSGRWDWESLRTSIMKHGVRNSLLTAPMPTASTAQILGNTEAFEPSTSNIFTRRVMAGEFPVVNKHLVKNLVSRGLWTEAVRNELIAHNGSVQSIAAIPDDVKTVYKTVWELSMRSIIDMAADRGIFIDQSASLNLFVSEPSHAKLTSMHFYAWKKGLKTGCYYLRTRSAVDAIKFTVDKAALVCSRDAAKNGGDCVMCSG